VAQSDKKTKTKAKRPSRSLAVSLQASGFTATVLALIVTGVVVLSPSLQVLAEQRQQIAQLEAELEATDLEVLRLEDQLERWNDRVFVETQARSRLMFVYPGDITYLVLDDLPDDADDSNVVISDEIQLAQPDWRESLFASYLVAATTQAAPTATEEPPGDTTLLPAPQSGGGESSGQ
jgi:cell division protein FtsB